MNLAFRNMQETSKTYIVGGGIAGVMLAYRLAVRAQEHGMPMPHLVFIDRHAEMGKETSYAYGGFISANSYETVFFSSAEAAKKALKTRGDKAGGLAVYDSPSEPEKHWMSEVERLSDTNPTVKEKNRLLYYKFGYGCINLWKEFMDRYPQLAQQSGFHYESGANGDGVLRIYDPDAGKEPDRDIAFLKETGGDGVHSRIAPPETLQAYRHVTEQYGDNAQYVVQHGGNVNGEVICTHIMKALQGMGAKVEFLKSVTVEGIQYSSNAPRINNLVVRDSEGKKAIGAFTDRYVFATGPDQKLWNELGFASSPIMGVAGTSLTVPIPEDFTGNRPKRPLKLVQRKGGPVIIPVRDAEGNNFVRVGGYTAFTGDRDINTKDAFAVEFLKQQFELLNQFYPELARRFLRDELDGDLNNLPSYRGSWVGQRPIAPDNHAIVGSHIVPKVNEPSLNSYMLTGLGASGMLGIGAADILAQYMGDEKNIKVPGISSPEDTALFLSMVSPERLGAFRSPVRKDNGIK